MLYYIINLINIMGHHDKHECTCDECCQGKRGKRGHRGYRGPQGETGPQGFQGLQGEIGIQGAQGEIGTQGPQGEIGTQGPQGTTGTQGTQGPQGTTGTQGTQGPQGTTGTQGTQGPQGATGTQGNQGPQGETGTQGNQGPQGFQGITGIQGFQGYQGANGSDATSRTHYGFHTASAFPITSSPTGGIFMGQEISASVPDIGNPANIINAFFTVAFPVCEFNLAEMCVGAASIGTATDLFNVAFVVYKSTCVDGIYGDPTETSLNAFITGINSTGRMRCGSGGVPITFSDCDLIAVLVYGTTTTNDDISVGPVTASICASMV